MRYYSSITFLLFLALILNKLFYFKGAYIVYNQTILEVSGTSVKLTRNRSTFILYLSNDNEALILYDYMARRIHEK